MFCGSGAKIKLQKSWALIIAQRERKKRKEEGKKENKKEQFIQMCLFNSWAWKVIYTDQHRQAELTTE